MIPKEIKYNLHYDNVRVISVKHLFLNDLNGPFDFVM